VAELPLAIKSVMRGETYLTPKISRSVVDRLLHDEAETDDPLEGLTTRQREILQLIAEGRSTKEIAGILDISGKTVETHRARMMDRLDIHDVPGLVRFAVRVGLVSENE
jgi:DNA-binding NarL/FixJ family response regulator